MCGGTDISQDTVDFARGLSPRVRGNLIEGLDALLKRRSIPACAGEPASPIAKAWAMSVYPRVCGGTWEQYAKRRNTKGLSPRVRGNRFGEERQMDARRSIPACAGEPAVPRVAGTGATVMGLSPRVRGNPLQVSHLALLP